MIQLICVNVRKTSGQDLDAALTGVPHRTSYLHTHEEAPASTPVPRSRPFAAPHPLTLPPRNTVPGWLPGEPVVLLARGSAIDHVSEWLTGDEAREQVSALVLLDDGPTAPCDRRPQAAYHGVIEFARDAAADPGEKLLLIASASANATTAADDHVVARLRAAFGAALGQTGDPRHHIHLCSLPLVPPPSPSPTPAAGALPQPFILLLRELLRPFLLALEPESAPFPSRQ